MSEVPGTGRSAGALLRAAREKQGLHIAALAAAIKVAPRKLDALENDRWTELPDATFTRALAQTVCRTLKVDARPVLDLLPPAGSMSLEHVGGALNAPFRERPGRDDPGLASLAIRPMIWAAGLLMAAALAIYFVPDGFWSSKLPALQTPPAVVVAPGAVPASAAAVVADAAASAPTLAASANGSAVPVASAPAASTTTGETVFSAPVADTPASTAASGLVQLRTTEASWMEVRDARGQLLLSRTVLPGESVGLDGTLPIRLTIGNAAATQLGFRGQPVDLAPRTKDNVARVELQ